MDINEKKIKIEDTGFHAALNYNERILQLVENRTQTVVSLRGDVAIVKGNHADIKQVEKILLELAYVYKRNGNITMNDVVTVLDFVEFDQKVVHRDAVAEQLDSSIVLSGYKEVVRAKTPKQNEYLRKVIDNDVVFSIGPAGTGKTYLAVAMAVAAIKRGEVSKIILSRPAVEAGESLGFLPGDLREKLDPYLRPLTDALFEMVHPEKMKAMMEKNIIEIIPLAYMRGRTLNNAFIILDEAQNATITQMKMFLTRLGFRSKAIITGDITQIDLVDKDKCGLINAKNVLTGIKGIEFVYFDNRDVVRHPLVAEIIKAYEHDQHNHEKKKDKQKSKKNKTERDD